MKDIVVIPCCQCWWLLPCRVTPKQGNSCNIPQESNSKKMERVRGLREPQNKPRDDFQDVRYRSLTRSALSCAERFDLHQTVIQSEFYCFDFQYIFLFQYIFQGLHQNQLFSKLLSYLLLPF